LLETSNKNRLIIIKYTDLIYDSLDGDKNRTEVIIGDRRYLRGIQEREGDEIDISFKDKETRGIEYVYTTYIKRLKY